jgi:hypothetical protein
MKIHIFFLEKKTSPGLAPGAKAATHSASTAMTTVRKRAACGVLDWLEEKTTRRLAHLSFSQTRL